MISHTEGVLLDVLLCDSLTCISLLCCEGKLYVCFIYIAENCFTLVHCLFSFYLGYIGLFYDSLTQTSSAWKCRRKAIGRMKALSLLTYFSEKNDCESEIYAVYVIMNLQNQNVTHFLRHYIVIAQTRTHTNTRTFKT